MIDASESEATGSGLESLPRYKSTKLQSRPKDERSQEDEKKTQSGNSRGCVDPDGFTSERQLDPVADIAVRSLTESTRNWPLMGSLLFLHFGMF